MRVELMLKFLRDRKLVDVVGERSTDPGLIGRLRAGDLIAYFNPSRRRHTHMTMYLGNGKIACHTYCRSDLPSCTWDNNWNLGQGQGFGWTF